MPVLRINVPLLFLLEANAVPSKCVTVLSASGGRARLNPIEADNLAVGSRGRVGRRWEKDKEKDGVYTCCILPYYLLYLMY